MRIELETHRIASDQMQRSPGHGGMRGVTIRLVQLTTGKRHRLGRTHAGAQSLIQIACSQNGHIVANRAYPAHHGGHAPGDQLGGQTGHIAACIGRVTRGNHEQTGQGARPLECRPQAFRAHEISMAFFVFHQQIGLSAFQQPVAGQVYDIIVFQLETPLQLGQVPSSANGGAVLFDKISQGGLMRSSSPS